MIGGIYNWFIPTSRRNRRDQRKFATQYQEMGNSGIEINDDNEEKIEEPYFEEIVDYSQVEKENSGPAKISYGK